MTSLNYRYPLPTQYQPDLASPAPQNMSSQRFCLRWNNHQSNLLSVFDQLLHDESFVDVTLAVEGQLLRAHKMVLSACSPYFQALFVNHPDKHPIVILKDVPYSDMRSLLDFMYRGEVSVDQDRLTAFLRVAESLRIKGLTEVNEEKCDTITSSLTQQNQMNANMPHLQRLQQNKRFGNPLNMLGNALLQPKRKRGRPRKLSGSSNGTPGDDFDRGDALVQGSPEMLEVKMGMDGFTGNNSDCSTGKSDAKDNDLDDTKVKEENEPVAGTSKEQFNNAKNTDEFQSSDSPITQKLLTPKQESTASEQPQNSEPNRINTTDSINNNNNTPPSTSATPNSNAMNAPTSGRQPVKRRARRRATSQSQDPAEQLTEMSVREEYYDYQENNQNHTNLPSSITVEIVPPIKQETVIISTEAARNMLNETMEQEDHLEKSMEPNAGVHFLTDDECNMMVSKLENSDNYEKKKNELLEYLTRHDGSVVCKLCGEVLASRTHWYRHKYKLHVNNLVNPAPLFKCTHCNVFFKSRKGYMGHISARHSENMEQHEELNISIKEEVVETTETPKINKKKEGKSADWEEQRVKEEKLVADIIDRVRKECEAQGAAVSRRGYSRRSTVMNSCN